MCKDHGELPHVQNETGQCTVTLPDMNVPRQAWMGMLQGYQEKQAQEGKKGPRLLNADGSNNLLKQTPRLYSQCKV